MTEQYNTLQHQNGESVMPEDSIRLLGPWEWQPLARTALRADGQAETLPGELPPPRRIWIPIRSADPEITHFRGRVLYRRYFHWVSKLDYWERIWIYFESADYFARVRLNDVLLGEHEGALDPFTFPITALLQKRNCLEVELEVPDTPIALQHAKWMLRETPACMNGPAILGEVRLEVFHPVRFGEVSVWTEWSPARALLHVQGQILTEAASDCELYVVYDNHTLHYQRLTVNAGQTPFSIEVPCPRIYVWDIQEGQPAALHYVQLELADRSVLLDARCCYVGFRSCSWEETRQAIRLNKHLLPVGTALPIVDIQTPVAEGKPFESADEIGQPVLCRLPLRGGYATEHAFIQRAQQQVCRLVQLLQHHPSILGWVVHTEPQLHDAPLDTALAGAIRQVDPQRPIFIQPNAESPELIHVGA